MKHLLSLRHSDVLAGFAARPMLVALDFDGTLAPIVKDPKAAALPASTRRLLQRLVARYPCVVISGRARDDLATRVAGIELAALVGNHGAEPDPSDARGHATRARRYEQLTRDWHERLQSQLAQLDGILIEDKRLSLAVHYRRSTKGEQARAAILELAQQLSEVRIVPGKHVINLVPADAPHKGSALLSLRKRLSLPSALYLGDDITDEDVFAIDDPEHVLSVRVGASDTSHAAYFLRSQTEVDVLLERLIALRRTAPVTHAP